MDSRWKQYACKVLRQKTSFICLKSNNKNGECGCNIVSMEKHGACPCWRQAWASLCWGLQLREPWEVTEGSSPFVTHWIMVWSYGWVATFTMIQKKLFYLLPGVQNYINLKISLQAPWCSVGWFVWLISKAALFFVVLIIVLHVCLFVSSSLLHHLFKNL